MTHVHASISLDRDTTVVAHSSERPNGPPLVWLEVGPGAAYIFLVPETIQEMLRALYDAEVIYTDHFAPDPPPPVEEMRRAVAYTNVTGEDWVMAELSVSELVNLNLPEESRG